MDADTFIMFLALGLTALLCLAINLKAGYAWLKWGSFVGIVLFSVAAALLAGSAFVETMLE